MRDRQRETDNERQTMRYIHLVVSQFRIDCLTVSQSPFVLPLDEEQSKMPVVTATVSTAASTAIGAGCWNSLVECSVQGVGHWSVAMSRWSTVQWLETILETTTSSSLLLQLPLERSCKQQINQLINESVLVLLFTKERYREPGTNRKCGSNRYVNKMMIRSIGK